MSLDILIRNGFVVDGSGNPWFKADVGISGGKIAKVDNLGSAQADTIVNAEGLVVSPGFIDMHSHSDLSVLANPKAESKVRQGVTTDVVGNCGNSAAPALGQALERVKKILQEYKVSYGALPQNDEEIAILSRSMLSILQELASDIEVPETHVAEQRIAPILVDDAEVAGGVSSLIRIQSAREEPADAFVAMPYRDHWFWIDDRDFKSKGMFSFLMFLFSLAETGTPQQAPVLTIPTG